MAKLKVLEITTSTCGACKMVEPLVQKVVAMQGERIDFEKREVDWGDPIVDKYNILQVPTFLFLNGEELLHKHSGAINIPILNRMISQNLEKIKPESNEQND